MNVILISGLPGSGKSTVARKVPKFLKNCCVINGDKIQDYVIYERYYGAGPRDVTNPDALKVIKDEIEGDIRYAESRGYENVVVEWRFANLLDRWKDGNNVIMKASANARFRRVFRREFVFASLEKNEFLQWDAETLATYGNIGVAMVVEKRGAAHNARRVAKKYGENIR